MNRAFLLILAPALFVAACFLAVGWGVVAPLLPGVLLLALAGAALVVKLFRRKSDPGNQKGSPETTH